MKSTAFYLSFLILLPVLPLSLVHAGEVLSSDFSEGSPEELGWTAEGYWSIADYNAAQHDPGKVLRYRASEERGKLVHKFPALKDVSNLTLTFDAGYGWGSSDHVQVIQVMLLDDDGNGYLFDVHRANADWGAQWARVSNNEVEQPAKWGSAIIDTRQDALVNGGGLRTFTVTMDQGIWAFNSEDWVGGPLEFVDTTTTSFTQLVLVGPSNTDDIVFGKVKLETK